VLTERDPAVPPRREDVFRHLEDLRTGTFEGAEPRAHRVDLFRRAVELAGPVVEGVLSETNDVFLDGTGEVAAVPVQDDGAGGQAARWELSWKEQRGATGRSGGSVGPIQVWARFLRDFTHPHLGGSKAGSWPMQVTTPEDAERQELVVRAIVEAELHERIFEGGWQIVPSFRN
jgi:hypothetical protein